ncbi:MAG: L-aspartate oxidase [Actinomycetota bacterium]
MTFDKVLSADCVVVGTGIAGLTTALSMPSLDVVLVTKTELGGGSTWWAQGGIAVSVSPEDSPARHAADTIAVGGGLNDAEAVGALAGHAAEGIAHLRQRGARFDTEPDGDLMLGREAGHSVRRIVHADGDATGAEVSRALVESTRSASHIRLLERVFVTDLVVDGGAVRGITARGPGGERLLIRSGAVVLATGGLGRVYANTTNPVEVTGDGLAMARRAGAAVADVEFLQFHPTALASGRDPMPLLTEALRGEGATLIDDEGARFMVGKHRDAELAPRDVVARAVWRRLMAGRKVFLDARTVGERFPDRFPTVFKECMDDGIDPRTTPIPAEPAAHYHMGGIAVDLSGRASVPGLWSVGEASRSGVHGANRLASNSLLEGLVFGEAVAADVVALGAEAPVVLEAPDPGPVPEVDPAAVASLRRLMWEKVGVVRDRIGLVAARRELATLAGSIPPAPSEGRNMIEASAMIATSALARTESRGAHHRSDFPESDPAWNHSLVFT